MRDQPDRAELRLLPWLLGVIATGFVLELVLSSPWANKTNFLYEHVALTVEGVRSGRLWTPVTYFLINPFFSLMSALGVVGTLWALRAMGRELEPILGGRRFLTAFLGSILVGGGVWLGVNWQHGGLLYGAMPGVAGLLALYACIFPDQPFSFFAMFLIPLTLTPKQLVLGLVVLNLFAFCLYELAGGTMFYAFAPSATLGGMAFGWMCHRLWRGDGWALGGRTKALSLPGWLRRGTRTAAAEPEVTRTDPRPDGMKAEVDRILDKINSQGFGSLTAAERRALDEAKNLLSRH